MCLHPTFVFSCAQRGFCVFAILEPSCLPWALPADRVTLTFSTDVFWQEGRASGAVYSGEEKLTELLVQVKMQL